MIDFLFVSLSFFAILGALGMILYTNPFKSTLSMLLTVLSLAGLFALLSSSFLFIVQIIVYGGAIITLVLFVIMFLNVQDEDLPDESSQKYYLILGVICLVPLNVMILQEMYKLPTVKFDVILNDFGTIYNVGSRLFSKFVLPFELVSILLLVALIGAVVLVRKKL
jgi:NADH-quinone oxidoreductase subunit J